MPYLFEPPFRKETYSLRGSLTYSYNVYLTVFKAAGVWQAAETPPDATLAAADRYLAVGGRAQIIDDATAAELISAGVGTCYPIQT